MIFGSKEKRHEQLLTKQQAAEQLGMKPRSFDRIKAHLIANKGLQEIRIGRSKKYRQASIDRMIARAAEKGTSLT
jgi:hypothetical protein